MLNDMKLKLILQAIDKASPELKKVEGGVKQVGTSAEVSSGSMSRFGASLGPAAIATAAAATAAALIKLGKAVLEAGMAWDKLENAMLSVKGSAAGAATELSFVADESKRLGLDLQTAGYGFTQLAAAAKGTGVSSAQVRDIFTAVGEASVVLGLSAADSAGAIRAISQVMSKGTVQAEELRGQLGERIPGAFQIAARAMGKTTAELNKMLEQGQLLSDDFLPKFAAQIRKEFGSTVPEATRKLRAELNRLNTAWFELKVELGKGGGMEAAAELTRDLTGAIDTLRQGLIDLKSFVDGAGLDVGLAKIFKDAVIGSNKLTASFRLMLGVLEKYQSRNDLGGIKLGLGISDDLLPPAIPPDSGPTPQTKTTWTKKELDDYAKLGKGITDSWQQIFKDRHEVQSRSLDTQIQMETEAAELSRIPWEATKDFWQMHAEDKFEVLSRSTEALIAMDATWQTSLMDSLDDLADYYDETFGDRMTGAVNTAFSSMEDTMVEFMLTGKASFKDMINSILADITRLMVQQNISTPLASALNVGLSGLFGSTQVSGASNLFGGEIYAGATAGEMSSYFSKYHNGGKVIPKFHFGGLASDEVYAKLQTDETVIDRDHTRRMNLAIDALEGGGGGGSPNITFNNHYDFSNSDENTVPQLESAIGQMEGRIMNNIKQSFKGGGELYNLSRG